MSKSSPSRMSAARRKAEMMMDQKLKRQEGFQHEQKRAHDAMAEKTARLRELRLAKEAADLAADKAAEEKTARMRELRLAKKAADKAAGGKAAKSGAAKRTAAQRSK